MTHRGGRRPLSGALAVVLAAGVALLGLGSWPPPRAAAAIRPPPTAVGFPYQRSMPIALWEVGTDQVATAPRLGTNYLIKSFSPGMNPVAYLDTAAARGWKVVLYFNDTVDYTHGTVFPSRVAAWVQKVRNHPALAGYLTVKEPSWSGISVSEMRSLRNAFRAADTNVKHLIYADFGDSPHFGGTANPWATGIADVLIMNWYPVRITKGYVPDAARWFPKVRATVNAVTPGVKLWVMGQAFGARQFDQRMPTAAELERQVDEAFKYAKVDGLTFHTWRNDLYQAVLGTSPTLQARLASIVGRIRSGTLVVP